MEKQLGEKIKIYKDVIIRKSVIGNNVIIGDDAFIDESNLENNCSIERRGMIFHSVLGNYSYTGYNTVVKYANIGKMCSISWNVSIGGPNHNYNRLTMHPFPISKKYGMVEFDETYESLKKPVIIGNDVWIGCNAVVLRNVNIADGAVIGAGAVVTHNIGPYEIWGGYLQKKLDKDFQMKSLPSW